MLQFVIIAKDGTDADALDRRMAARPLHLEGSRKLKEANNFVVGGATLDKEGKMNGSVMIVQFETEEDLKNYMDNDPYITGNVWQKIEVKPFKVADV
jgi:uncharacterized protein YciI